MHKKGKRVIVIVLIPCFSFLVLTTITYHLHMYLCQKIEKFGIYKPLRIVSIYVRNDILNEARHISLKYIFR